MNINIYLWYTKFRYSIDTKYLVLMVLAGLHYNKKITDAKLKGQFKALRAGTLQKYRNTYYSDITNKWYNYESSYDIFLDYVHLLGSINTIPLKELLKYIQLFEGRNYNHALNVFGSEYVYSIFSFWNPQTYSNSNFSDYIDLYIPNICVTTQSYECDECGHIHHNYSKRQNENVKVISNWIHKQKKGNLDKIPVYNVDSRGRDPYSIKIN